MKIKIKDIPWSEVSNHFYSALPEAQQIWESQLRGKFLELTGEKRKYRFQHKDGNNINVLGYETTFLLDDGSFWACEICAEIGD